MINELSIKRKTHVLDLLILAAISCFVLFPALGQNRHWASREIRHAEIIREMAESGNYLIPKLLGRTYHDKPPVMHSIAAVLTRVTGSPSMAIARMPSAMAGLLGVLATYGIGILLLNRRVALVGAIALLGIPGYSIMAREARPDMILCAAILFSCLCLGFGMKEGRGSRRAIYFAAAGLFAGLGVVTKGPYGVLFPALFVIFAPFRRQDLKRPRMECVYFVFGLLVALAAWAAPSYLCDHGEYLRKVVFQHDLSIGESVRDDKSLFYYVWHGSVLSLPLLLSLPLAIIDIRKRGYSAPLTIAGTMFAIISCYPKKRRHYLVPLYPFLALGLAASIVHLSEKNRLIRILAWVFIALSVLAVPVYYTLVLPRAYPYEKSPMYFAQEITKIMGPNAQVYVTSFDEELAWTGRQYRGIHKFDCKDSSAGRMLCNTEAGSYLAISDEDLESLKKITQPFPKELVLEHKIGRDKMMLFRLKQDW